MIFKRVLVSIFFLLATKLVSQEINLPKNIIKSYNEKQFIYLFTKNSYCNVDVKNYIISEPVEFNNNGFDINNFSLVKINEIFYFVQNVGGMVLELKNNNLQRIDSSFIHKMQISSSVFKFNNEIYRYGGYGFFSAREFLVKFDFKTREWEAVNVNSKLIPTARFSNDFFVDENSLTIIGGTTVSRYNRENKFQLKDVWRFSFKELKWKFLLESEEIFTIGSKLLKFDNKILFKNEDYLKILNLDSYELSYFDLTKTSLKINKKFKTHYYNGSFHFIIERNNGDSVLVSRTNKELLGIPKFSKSLTNKNYFYFTALSIIGIILLLIITIFVLQRYFYFVILKPNKIKHKNKNVFITDEEYIVLKEFFRNNNSLENEKLQNLLDKDQYERSYNIRRKNNILDTLNSKFQILFNNNNSNYFDVKKSDFDKRYKKYILNLMNLKTIIKSK